MTNKAFGLDIGSATIKAVELKQDKGKFFLVSHTVVSTPAKGMLSDSPLDQEEMAQAIKKAASDLKTQTKNVNIALADNQVYTKIIEMPPLSDKELSLAIYWEAEQYIPVPLANITLVWSVLKRPQNPQSGERMIVLMVGAPTVLINKYEKLLALSGLNLVSMETGILSTMRALVYPGFPPSVILSIGAASTSLAIVREEILVFTYSIPTGGVAISRSIEADFGLTKDQSEAYKKTYGVSGEGIGQKIGKSTEPILLSILSEIRKSLAFYAQKYKDNSSVQQLLLSGGTARLPGIDLFFAENLGMETAIASPWKKLSDQNIPQDLIVSSSDFTIAVGLAMKSYE